MLIVPKPTEPPVITGPAPTHWLAVGQANVVNVDSKAEPGTACGAPTVTPEAPIWIGTTAAMLTGKVGSSDSPAATQMELLAQATATRLATAAGAGTGLAALTEPGATVNGTTSSPAMAKQSPAVVQATALRTVTSATGWVGPTLTAPGPVTAIGATEPSPRTATQAAGLTHASPVTVAVVLTVSPARSLSSPLASTATGTTMPPADAAP